jgi:saccharopine dehydrogenase-like NADP-dependent oxidoreductase
MKAIICGVGRMGTAISWAMKQFGFDVVCVDSDHTASDRLQLLLGKDFIFYRTKHISDDIAEILSIELPDVVISSLPYHQTQHVANKCIELEFPFCDLGGRVDVSKEINEAATAHATRPVFTDLGLAPGLVNILAEEGCRKAYGATDVQMMVGGLPDYLQSNKNLLRYTSTWSLDGLINEYKDDCLVLRDGQVCTVRGMDGLDMRVNTSNLGVLEAFYTSGGASHSIESMKDRGVQNCSYKTLRYPGHCAIIKFLIRDCELDDAALAKIFTKGLQTEETIHDVVVVIAEAKSVTSGLKWRREITIKGDHLQHVSSFTAMQKGTAFPIAAVARLIAEGEMEGDKDQHRDYYTQYPKALSYRDVPFDKFKTYLKELNLEI